MTVDWTLTSDADPGDDTSGNLVPYFVSDGDVVALTGRVNNQWLKTKDTPDTVTHWSLVVLPDLPA